MKLNRLFYLAIAFLGLCLISCNKQLKREVVAKYVDDSGKYTFITPVAPVQEEEEFGKLKTAFPKEVGELGFKLIKPEHKLPATDDELYNVNLHYEYEVNKYGTDPHNYAELIIQYLDSDNNMVIDTLLKPKVDHLAGLSSSLYVSDDITFTKRSGDPIYMATFLSPYAYTYMNVEMTVEKKKKNGSEPEIESLNWDYSQSHESFHITTLGQEFIIQAKYLYLP